MLVKDAAGNRELLEEIARGYDRLGDVQGNPYFANLGDTGGALSSYRKALSIRDGIPDTSPTFCRTGFAATPGSHRFWRPRATCGPPRKR